MISDESLASLKERHSAAYELQKAAVVAADRLHHELHIEKWNRDNGLPAARPALSEMCVQFVGCPQLRQAVNKVKHVLARLEA